MNPAIQSMKDWLQTCPLVAAVIDNGVVFRVSWLSPDVDEYSIEDVPVDPFLEHRMNGDFMQKVFVLASREEYNQNPEYQAERSGFWDDLTAWVSEQNRIKHFPKLNGKRIPVNVAVTSNSYILTSGDGRCRAQIQLRLVYFQPKGVVIS